ncbi:hypothetical protein SAMD00019534_040220, partial [Acytostelium subglobosum LB1]|uniref:hypothetical protein n=1 Tax=Acytostelium subglobosum LB1 TaxID=1410327 RepID=UPI000644F956
VTNIVSWQGRQTGDSVSNHPPIQDVLYISTTINPFIHPSIHSINQNTSNLSIGHKQTH